MNDVGEVQAEKGLECIEGDERNRLLARFA